jgi:hypothetical protein
MTLYGSRMLLQDIRFFYGWLSNRNSQLKIDFIGFVYIVLIDAHSVSATMKITTTCSLSAPILKRSGGMFVTDTKGWDERIRWATVTWHGKWVSSIFLVNWVSQLQCIMYGKNGMQGCFAGMSRTSNLVFNQIECIIRDKLDLMRNVLPTNENKRIQRAWRVNNIDSSFDS